MAVHIFLGAKLTISQGIKTLWSHLLVSKNTALYLFTGCFSFRFLFHKNCGQFIALDSNRTTARRVDSYNHGVVLSEKPLPDNHLFQVCIRKLNSRWTGSVMIGVTAQDPDSLTSLPSTANSIKISPWIVVNNAVYVNGNKVGKSRAHYLTIRKRASKWNAWGKMMQVMIWPQSRNCSKLAPFVVQTGHRAKNAVLYLVFGISVILSLKLMPQI